MTGTICMKTIGSVLIYELLSAGGLGGMPDESAHLSAGTHRRGKPPGDATPTGCDRSLLAQGIAMRAALIADLAARDGLAVTAVDSLLAPLTAGHDRLSMIRPRAGEEPAAFLHRVAPAFERVWVIAPETDGVLSTLHDAVGDERWIGCTGPAITLASSKRRTRERLAGHAITTPQGWQPGLPAPRESGPWVVKPDDGAGAEDVRFLTGFEAARANLESRLSSGQPATLEAWVAGEAMSLSLLCAPHRTELLSINRQHIGVAPDGAVRYTGVSPAIEQVASAAGREFAQLSRRVAAAVPGLSGFVGIDLVRTPDGRLVVIEINPRLTCAFVGLSALLGRNLGVEIVLSAPAPEALPAGSACAFLRSRADA